MIIEITSSIPTFKRVRLHPGLNVLLADTSPESSERQTRNSAGKTSFVEIIHFLFGANADKDSLFRLPQMIEHSFTGKLIVAGKQFVVSRSGSDPSKIFLIEGELSALPTRTDKSTGRIFISNTNWRAFLGQSMFGLPLVASGTDFEDSGVPTFRAMFSYFARRRNSGAFLHPERQSEMQQRGDWQVNLSYLLGLDWRIPFEFQNVRNREGSLEELKRAAKAGTFGDLLGTVAELRPQVTIAESKAARLRDHLARFEVLDSYRDLTRRAARAKNELQAMARESVVLNETLDHLEKALVLETPPDQSEVQRLYSEAGVQLPGVALRRLSEVTSFYASIVENRRAHLTQEIAEVTAEIAARERRSAALDAERTGTPIENRLDELWSQLHFTNPGLLGGRTDFQDRWAEPISLGDAAAAARLRERIRPFVLRRMKSEVARDLPPRTDAIMYVELDEAERVTYDAIRAATQSEIVALLQAGGGVMAALEALLRLRQAACHPALLPGAVRGGPAPPQSSKLQRLLEALDDVVADGHRALVFSQWTSLLDLIEPHLQAAGIAFTRLDGTTIDRAGVVASFQADAGPPVMLLSLKAGGTGLNLTAADHVFLIDPWWNPAVEDQAADRAHRIGQDKPVMVYRMVARDTVEERILELQDRKRALADAALADAGAAAAITRDDLLALLV